MAPIRAHIRLGIHPRQWKTARGATIPKLGKDDYRLAKSYRAISLLNYLGKMVEKVAAMMVSAPARPQGASTRDSTDTGRRGRLRTRLVSSSHRPRRPGTAVASLELS